MTEQENEHIKNGDNLDDVNENNRKSTKSELDQRNETEPPQDDCFALHGGDPRSLDLNRCLLLSNVPSVLLGDSFEIFSDCMLDWIAQDFKVSRDAMEKIVRIPKLQADAENQEMALRAIVLFKSRVHKHRVFAQKNLAAESSIKLSVLESIPREFYELEDDLEMADEVIGDEEGADEHDNVNENEDEEKGKEIAESQPETVGDEANLAEHEERSTAGEGKDANGEEGGENEDEGEDDKMSYKRKEYADEDLDVPFEVNWEGAPEFQWKLCSSPSDTRRLIIENIFWGDLQNAFIYRVMLKAETVDITFPMRFNIEGSKQMYGKLTLTFQWSMQIMNEAMRHLIYVRCPKGRRIKIFLPQTPAAVRMKEDFEGKLGRVIQPTRRMHQLVLKVLPENYELTMDVAKELFAPSEPAEVENVQDDLGQQCAVVTMANVEDTIKVHANNSFVFLKREEEEDWKCHVFLRGVEAHFGSLITRWDKKKIASLDEKRKGSTTKRSSGEKSSNTPAKKSRPSSSRATRGGPGRSGRKGKGRYSDPFLNAYPPRYEMDMRRRMDMMRPGGYGGYPGGMYPRDGYEPYDRRRNY